MDRLGELAGWLLFALVVSLYQVHLSTDARPRVDGRVLWWVTVAYGVVLFLSHRVVAARWFRGHGLVPGWAAHALAVGTAVWLTGSINSPFLFLFHLLILGAALMMGVSGALFTAGTCTLVVAVVAAIPSDVAALSADGIVRLVAILSSLWLVAYLGWRMAGDVAEERRRLEKANANLSARFAESSLLYAFSHSLSSATDMEHLSAAALEQLAGVTGATSALLFLYGPETEEIALESAIGVPEKALAALRRQSVSEDSPGAAGQVAYTLEGLYVPDVAASDDLASRLPLARRFGVRGVLAEPLVARGELVGVVEAASTAPLALTGEDLRLFRVLCNDFALSLENMRLAVEAQDRARIERLVNRISTRIQSTLDVATVLDTAAQELCIAAGASRCLVLRPRDGAPPLVSHEYCQPGVPSVGIGRESNAGVCWRSLATASTIACDDVVRDPDLRDEDRQELLSMDTHAALATALRHRDKVLGAIALHECARPRQWRDADVALLEAVAGQVAAGVENALLYQETRRKGDEVAAKNRELEAFVYTASHDLRAPLVTIQGFASILLADYSEGLDADARFYLGRIRANTGRMERLIDDLLELSRAGRAAGRREEVDVGGVVSEALEGLQAQIRERAVEIVVGDSWPTVPCDRDRLLQVFTNLIGNAIKFLGPDNAHPRIEVGWHDRGEAAEFNVRDNGIGIEPEYHERVFAVFQRLNELEQVEGTGVGLAIVKRIVDVHGGMVWVDSAKGQGATFRFTLPRSCEGGAE